MSNLQKQMYNKRFSTPPLPTTSNRLQGRKRDYTPLNWNVYFKDKAKVKVGDKCLFNVYTTGEKGPLLVLLHGGGYSGLTWALFSASITQLAECRILAIDLRGHGETTTDNDEDLSIDTLAKDVGQVVETMYQDEPPPIVVIGHSMGGAIGVHTVYHDYLPSCIGLVVIDVVEGTALDALQSMQTFLKSRPKHFATMERAIEWCVRSGQVRNLESARVSMPGQLKGVSVPATALTEDKITEEEAEEQPEDQQQPPWQQHSEASAYTWRINLSKTEHHWQGWFHNLSSIFLECQVPKILLLAGIDRLDKELTIGQMQGKFQMQVLPQSGHAVHEDVPEKVAEAISNFLVRHKFAKPLTDFNRMFPCC